MSDSTALRLVGADALALLHRISTNAVAELAPGQVRATLFCDFRGRLLHRVVVGVTSDRAVWLFRDDAPGGPLGEFLDRHVFRDDVRIEDRSAALPVRRSDDPAGPAPGTLIERDGIPAALHAGDGDILVVDAGAGAPDGPASERRRILAGRAAHGREIVEAFTPFEVGLAHEVHLDKGCFTGQEALMRLITYKGVRRRLARVGGRGPSPEVPADVTAGGRPAGVLTSAIADGDTWIGLAVLRYEAVEAPIALALPDGATIGPAEPLVSTRPQGR